MGAKKETDDKQIFWYLLEQEPNREHISRYVLFKEWETQRIFKTRSGTEFPRCYIYFLKAVAGIDW